MAEIYEQFAGIPSAGSHGVYEDPLNYVLSHHFEVAAAIEAEGMARSIAAQRQLAMHRDEGHARIHVEVGSVDWTVWLEDRSDEPAALAIEYGAQGGRGGARPLSAAFPEVML